MGPLLSAIMAGLLTSFSPCVISALPFVISSSFGKNPRGPLYLVAGLISSFLILGVGFALASKVMGLDQNGFKVISAYLFLILGLIFLFPSVSNWLSKRLSPVANSSNRIADRINLESAWGQFLLGFLFGFIWSPCSGPSLGLAITLVAKEGDIFHGGLIMLIYGVSASLPLLFVAYVSKTFVQKNLKKIDQIHGLIKKGMGLFLIMFSVATLTGLDNELEAFLIANMPPFILDLITRF